MNMKEYCFETLHSMYLLGKISIKDGCRFNLKEIMNPLQSQHDRNVVMYIGENTYLKGFDNYDVILFTKDGNKLAVNVEDFIEYIGEVTEIKVDNVNGKHPAVFKNDDGENEVLISKLLGVLKWLRK